MQNVYFSKFTFNSKTSVNVKIFIRRFEGKCKYFSSVKLVSFRLLALSHNVLTNHGFKYMFICRKDLYLPKRKPQGNTALDFVIVSYMPVKREDLIFFKNVDFSKRQEMKVG